MISDKYGYKILPDKGLILKYYCGSFSLQDFIKCTTETALDSLYDSAFSVINDFREATFSMGINELNAFVNLMKENKKLYSKRSITFLTSTPNQTVYTLMLELLKDEPLINKKTFSTLLEAVKWLGFQPDDFASIENELEKLKNSLVTPSV
jgi:hypothetical protein